MARDLPRSTASGSAKPTIGTTDLGLSPEERIRIAIEAVGMATWDADLDSGRNLWSESHFRLFGYEPHPDGEATFQMWLDRVHPEDRDRVLASFEEARKRGPLYRIEYRVLRPDNTVVWISAAGRFQYDADGKACSISGVLFDITNRKLADEQIQRQFAELEAIYETAPLGLCVLDTELRFRRINKLLAELNGLSIQDHIGRTVREILPVVADQAEQMMRQVLETGQPVQFELHGETPALPGVRRVWDESWYPLRDAEGNITAVGVITEEITERRQAEEALRKADRISAAGRMAATVAHEINNPLASIVNSLYLLGKEPLSETAHKYLAMTQAELQRVVHITRQTLAFHRTADAPAAFNISEVAEELVKAFQAVSTTQNVTINFSAEREHFMHGFPGEIRQVLTNLLTNSLEADATTVTVRVRPWRDWSHNHRRGVRITVHDNGKGIARKHFASIFEPFFTTTGERGTGLGLWVARGILAKHEGTIRLRSSVAAGRTGTCIAIFLPTLVAHAPKRHQKASSPTVA